VPNVCRKKFSKMRSEGFFLFLSSVIVETVIVGRFVSLYVNMSSVIFIFLRAMLHNGLNMVRLAFQRSIFSIYNYVYLLLLSSYLALSAKCTIFFVCAQHGHLVSKDTRLFQREEVPYRRVGEAC